MEYEKYIKSYDGVNLFFKKNEVEKAKAVVVIVHGLCEHLGRYNHVASAMIESGLSVYRFDHRGHGRSEGTRAHYNKYEDICLDVKTVVDIAKEENPNKKIFVLGHSLGGYATALFGTKFPGYVNGIVLSGALTRYNAQICGPLPMKLPSDTYLPNELGAGVCSDSAVIEAYGKDPLVEKSFTVGLINCAGEGIEWMKTNAKDFVSPVLILHGANDGLVAEKDSRELFGEISSDDKSLHIFSGLCHEIMNEPCKKEIIQEIIDWILKRA